MTATGNGTGRPRPTPAIDEGSREARRLAATILEVLAGLRTPTQAAQALTLSLPRYYQLEARGLEGLVAALVPKPRGRQRTPTSELAAARQENERLKRDLGRQQALVRLAQRSVGLSPPPASTKAKRKRRATARALVAAERLRVEATPTEVAES